MTSCAEVQEYAVLDLKCEINRSSQPAFRCCVKYSHVVELCNKVQAMSLKLEATRQEQSAVKFSEIVVN